MGGKINLHWSIWREGKYLDLWSINHVVSGMFLGAIFYLLGGNFIMSSIAALATMIIWELFEIVKKIHETLINKVVDVIVGYVGFILSYYFYFNNSNLNKILVLIFIALLIVVLNLWGFFALKKPINEGNRALQNY